MGGGKGRSKPQEIIQPPPPPPAPIEMPAFHFPKGGGGYDYKKAADDAKEAQEEAQRQAGIQERDQLYADYMNAASSSTDYINTQIGEERANARLLGIDFNITDAQKQKRIEDYFATVWGAGDQSRLENLFKTWGDPQGFEGFVMNRGTGNKGTDTKKGKPVHGEPVLKTVPSTRKTLTSEEETLDKATLLGG